MERRTYMIVLIVAALAAVVCSFLPHRSHSPHHTLPMPAALSQDVYVWQRSWTPAVQTAVRERGTKFGEIIPLLAEVAWKNGEAKPTHVKAGLRRAAGDRQTDWHRAADRSRWKVRSRAIHSIRPAHNHTPSATSRPIWSIDSNANRSHPPSCRSILTARNQN